MTKQPSVSNLLTQIARYSSVYNADMWVVGGFVRTLFRGKMAHDIDIAMRGDVIGFARTLADAIGGAFFLLDEERGTARVVHGKIDDLAATDLELLPDSSERLYIDIAHLRADTLEEDLLARDFTVNALAIPISAFANKPQELSEGFAWKWHNGLPVCDPSDGLRDLLSEQLRVCSNRSLSDDPLRLLRAVRFAASDGFALLPELQASIKKLAPSIRTPAPERVRDELFKIFAHVSVAPWLRLLDELGLLTQIFPELEAARNCDQPRVHFLPVLAHSIETVAAVDWIVAQIDKPDTLSKLPSTARPVAVQTHPTLKLDLPHQEQLNQHMNELVGGVPRRVLFKLAALLHDNAKPQTKQTKPDGGVSFYQHQEIGSEVAKTICQRMRLSRAATNYVAGLVRAHMRPGQLGSQPVTLRAALRLFRDTGGNTPNSNNFGLDTLLHAMADHLATRGPHVTEQGWIDHNIWTGALFELYWSQPTQPPKPLLDGHRLMEALRLEPGPILGQLLNEVREAQAANEIGTSEEALELAQQLYQKYQHNPERVKES
jgi:poly(A) polymerase